MIMQSATNIYSEDDDRQAAEAIVKRIISAGRRVNCGTVTYPIADDNTKLG